MHREMQASHNLLLKGYTSLKLLLISSEHDVVIVDTFVMIAERTRYE
jgi:hypothetical protein